MTSFSDAAWQRVAPLREAIHALPFNRELADGTLSTRPLPRLRHRRTRCISGSMRAYWRWPGAEGPDGAVLHAFASCALEAVAVEQALHEQYLAQFGVDPARLADAEPSPDCLGYTSFLLATAYHDPWEVLVAALLPCFWVYWDVGSAIARRAAADKSVSCMDRHLCRRRFRRGGAHGHRHHRPRRGGSDAGDRQARMLTAFVRSTQYEWLFWDGAYQQRGWPAV